MQVTKLDVVSVLTWAFWISIQYIVPSGAVNTLLYNRDGIHLSKKGTVKLAEKFDFKCIVKKRTVKKDGNISGNSRQAGRKREVI